MPSRTTPTHVQPVRGCPTTVKIYRIEASPFWQFRFFVQGKYIRKSTEVTNKTEAIQKAKEFYRDIIVKEKQDIAVHPTTFFAVAKQFLDWQALQIKIGRITSRSHQEDIYKLKSDVLPFFQSMDVATITKATIEEYLNTLTPRELSKSTLNKHVCLIRKILAFAVDRGIIKAAPACPPIGVEDNPRPYFTRQESNLLCRAAHRYAETEHVADYVLKGKPIRKLRFDHDFAYLIDFGLQVFVRISDIKKLRHRHVSVISEGGSTYLEIFPPSSKTAQRSSCSMPQAVHFYQMLKFRHEAKGFGKADDFVFYPQYPEREYAIQVMGRLFRHLLDELDLRKDKWGNNRKLYSLRHSALMYRFLYGDKVDLFLLAKNALTSVEILQRFYLSHAESKMRIKELQSFKDKEAEISYLLQPVDDERLDARLDELFAKTS